MFRALGLETREQRAWALYDWANSALYTVVITAVFPVYYGRVAAAGLPENDAKFYFRAATTAALTCAALLSPLLGALADFRGERKRFLGLATCVGVLSTAALGLVGEGDWKFGLVAFALASVAVGIAVVFYDALLPAVARPDQYDRVSSAGFAAGYVGGGLVLVANLAWILHPEWIGITRAEDGGDPTLPSRLAFLSVALWWGAFAIPLLRRVPEPARVLESDEHPGRPELAVACERIGETLRSLRRFRHAFLMLLAFLLYSDGINTIIRFAASFGEAQGISIDTMMQAFVVVQIVAFPAALLFGRLAGVIGAKRGIYLAIAVYACVCLYASRMSSNRDFWILALLVALVQGGSQALSRSLYASMTPRHKSAEFFSFFSLCEKFGAIFGPLLLTFAAAAGVSDRTAILALLGFFGAGALVLSRVDVEAGRRAAEEASP
jgi:UMF1 family MFS transporter